MVDLDELERLEREATPGPWGYRMNPHGGARVQTGSVGIADVLSRGGVPHPVQEHCEANARLIATARNALPDLIAELRMLRAAHEEREEVQAAWAQGLRKAYEAGRRDALREAIDLCRRTEAGDTNHDWREAAKCCRELIESLAAKAAEEAAR